MTEAKIKKFAQELAGEFLEGKSPKKLATLSAEEILVHMDRILSKVENEYSLLVTHAMDTASAEAEVSDSESWWDGNDEHDDDDEVSHTSSEVAHDNDDGYNYDDVDEDYD